MAAAGSVRHLSFLVVALTLAVLVPASSDESPPGRQGVAKAPAEAAVAVGGGRRERAVAAQVPVEADSAGLEPPREAPVSALSQPRDRFVIAALPTHPMAVAAPESLIEVGWEALWKCDVASARQHFAAAAQDEGSSYARGRAALFLAFSYYHWDKHHETADAIAEHVVQNTDEPELKAFAEAMRRAQQAMREQDYPGAIAHYQGFAQQWRGTPSGAWAAIRAGSIYRDDLGDYPAARLAYEAAAQDYAGTRYEAEAIVNIAECLNWYESAYLEAEQVYEQAFELAQTRGIQMRAWLGLGDCYRLTIRYRKAVATLTAYLEAFPTDPHARFFRAESAMRLGEWELAISDVQQFFASSCQEGWARIPALIMAGQYAFMQGDAAAAERDFMAAVEHPQDRPEKAKALVGIGHCRAARGDWRGAVEAFLEARDDDPSRDGEGPPTAFATGGSLAMEATPAVERAGRLFCAGVVYGAVGEVEQADRALREVARDPSAGLVAAVARDRLATLHYDRGQQARDRGDMADALEAWRTGVHADANLYRKARYSLAVSQLYASLWRWEEAKLAAQEVLKLDPPVAPYLLRRKLAQQQIAHACFAQGLHKEALSRFEGLLAAEEDEGGRERLLRSIDAVRDAMAREREPEAAETEPRTGSVEEDR